MNFRDHLAPHLLTDGARMEDLPSLSSALVNFLTSVPGLSMFATAMGTGPLGGNLEAVSSRFLPILVLGYLVTALRSIAIWALQRFSFRKFVCE